MLRFKAFSGIDLRIVEAEINSWLSRGEPDVKHMTQIEMSSGGVMVSFLYDEGFMASEQRLTEEAALPRSHPSVLDPIKVDQEQV